jgi:pilus assembly protein CpaC
MPAVAAIKTELLIEVKYSSAKAALMKLKIGIAIILFMFAAGGQVKALPAAPTATAGEEAQLQESRAQLHVQLGKSFLIASQQELQRVSVTDPAIASTVIVSPTQILVHGLKAGSGTLILWDSQERPQVFDLTVDFDISSLRETIRAMFPGETLQIAQSGGSLLLTGNVSSKTVSDRAAAVAATVSPAVVNMVQTTEARQTVLLQVKFAEVDRAAIQQLGLNLFSTGATNTIGLTSTQQFGESTANVGAVPATTRGGVTVQSPSVAAGGIGRTLQDTPAAFGFSDLLNVFLFRPDLNLGAQIKALEQKNLLQVLAEPNVLAVNGSEASFLAGGEFPFPVLQGGSVANAVTIQFKEFGVRLNFLPQVLPDGVIRLKVAPEVSSLDFANGLTVSGFTVPSLSSRKATTQVELRDGQSFAIAGLIDNRLTEIASKIPVLGDVPFLGNFFRSRAQNKTKTELLVMVTPRLVPGVPPELLPTTPEFPKPFLDPQKFDDKSGGAPSHGGTGR